MLSVERAGTRRISVYTPSAIPPGIIPKEPYASFIVDDRKVPDRPLQGMRVGVVREFMVKHTKNDVAVSDQLDQEIKTILREKLVKLPAPIGSADVATLANVSRGMTGADLKAVVEDAKLLYAQDVVLNSPSRPAEEYYLEAIATVKANGRRRSRRTSPSPIGAVQFGFQLEELDEF